MTHYDRLIDSIKNEIYLLFKVTDQWDEDETTKTAHKILTIVEEFQQKRSQKKISYIIF